MHLRFLTTTTLAVASLPFFTAKEQSLKETYLRPRRFQLSSLGNTRAEGQETPRRFSSAPYIKMFIFRLFFSVALKRVGGSSVGNGKEGGLASAGFVREDGDFITPETHCVQSGMSVRVFFFPTKIRLCLVYNDGV